LGSWENESTNAVGLGGEAVPRKGAALAFCRRAGCRQKAPTACIKRKACHCGVQADTPAAAGNMNFEG